MQQVLEILRDRINCPGGYQWAHDLINGDVDCKRLAICLAIELRKPSEEILLMEHLDRIFENCDYDHTRFGAENLSYPRCWFEEKRERIWRELCTGDSCIIPTNNPIDATSNDYLYVTIIDFYILYNHYLRKAGAKIESAEVNSEEVEKFVEEHPDLLEEVGSFGGNKRAIWVTTINELERIKSQDTNYNESTNIMIGLGLSPRYSSKDLFPKCWNTYFKVEYPKPPGITAYQPSSLNKNWKDAKEDLYLSYIKKDSFGLTYATDASGLSAKEQIHEPLKEARGLRISPVGKFIELKLDKSAILDEGLKRLSL